MCSMTTLGPAKAERSSSATHKNCAGHVSWYSRRRTCDMRFLCSLTFELSGHLRQAARARAEKMYRVPQTGPWWPAVGAPLERMVRPRCRPTYDPALWHVLDPYSSKLAGGALLGAA